MLKSLPSSGPLLPHLLISVLFRSHLSQFFWSISGNSLFSSLHSFRGKFQKSDLNSPATSASFLVACPGIFGVIGLNDFPLFSRTKSQQRTPWGSAISNLKSSIKYYSFFSISKKTTQKSPAPLVLPGARSSLSREASRLPHPGRMGKCTLPFGRVPERVEGPGVRPITRYLFLRNNSRSISSRSPVQKMSPYLIARPPTSSTPSLLIIPASSLFPYFFLRLTPYLCLISELSLFLFSNIKSLLSDHKSGTILFFRYEERISYP